VEGTKTSTLVLAPYPPDRMIPGMEIIIRVLLPDLLTLSIREPGHVLVVSTDTSSGHEEEEGQPCNHLFLLLVKALSEDFGLNTFSALIYTN
jgi:hypothetical protein